MKLSNNTILITGGASGIGLGLAERFVQENNTVIICGRREDALKAVTDRYPSVISRVCDLTVESERVELYDWVQENHSDLNVLVNNAGIQNWMQWNEADFYARAKSEIEINVIAPIHLTTLFLNLNSLKTIMNVTSGLAFVQLAKAPVYCATKAFFHSLTLSQRYLLRDREIEVIEIIPPALNTDLGGKGLHDDQPPVSAFIDSIFEQIKLGKDELTYGFSELMTTASPEMIKATFDRMNPPR
ncbi:MAG TPA: SDR family NAD(P)-dependent oxidoreductase [Saprospiraceae bacterium]|mgnify:FL=1|nr:SDR family NAD(P)-dependent oxidoreductase [Saprospiraceae bacterium]